MPVARTRNPHEDIPCQPLNDPAQDPTPDPQPATEDDPGKH